MSDNHTATSKDRSVSGMFEAYFNEACLGKSFPTLSGIHRPLLLSLAIEVFHESKKRQLTEGNAGLFEDAIRSKITSEVEQFSQYLKANSKYSYYDPDRLIDVVVAEMLTELPTAMKRYINLVLVWRQESAFEESDYVIDAPSVAIAEHPMVTFNRELAILECLNNTANDSQRSLRRFEIVCIMRAGNAFLKRNEWTHRGIKHSE